MTRAFLSLGSNIEPEKNILEAVKLLAKHVKILKTSTVYLTKPLGRKSDPSFYNCVIKIETDIEPLKLKTDILRVIEKKLGRKRSTDKYVPRTIDIDIILYGNAVYSTDDVVIPDPNITERPFLAIPLCEIEPDLTLPGLNVSISEVASKFRNHLMIPLMGYTMTLRKLISNLA